MTIDTLYDLIIKHLTHGYRVWIGKRVSDPRNEHVWRLQLCNVQNCKAHYHLRWDDTYRDRSLPWQHNIDIYSWLVYGKMYSDGLDK